MKKATNALSLGSATNAAKRAADIVHTLQNNGDLEITPLTAQLNGILRAYGENNPDVTAIDLPALKAVSSKLYTVFTAHGTAQTADRLNSILSEYAHPPRLSGHNNTRWHLHVDSNDDAPWAEWLAASSALAMAVLLAEWQRNPGRLCASLSCRRPYIDTGKGGGRNYCSPRCATRERVAAYRRK